VTPEAVDLLLLLFCTDGDLLFPLLLLLLKALWPVDPSPFGIMGGGDTD